LLSAFLLAFPALFSIVNPLGGAIIFHEVTARQTHAQRVALARRVAIYSAIVMLVTLGAGSYIRHHDRCAAHRRRAGGGGAGL
jgi:multiple antibiotic resistance protein